MNRPLCGGMSIVLALAMAGVAAGGVIVDHSGPALTYSYLSDLDPFAGGTVNLRADDFTLDSAAVLSDVHWWGTYFDVGLPLQPDDFTVRIYAMADDEPEAAPLYEWAVGGANREDTGLLQADILPVYSYWAFVPATALPAGDYALYIANNTLQDPQGWFWCQNTTQDGQHWVRLEEGGTWWVTYVDLAFVLTDDAIPEPATLSLLALGGLGLLARRRRR